MSYNEMNTVKEFGNLYSTEPSIVKEFRTLYEYVCNLGRCFNQVHDRLEKIENSLNEFGSSQSTLVEENTADIRTIRETMVHKDEFTNFIEKMKVSLGEILPPLPPLADDTPVTEDHSEEPIDF